MLWPKWPSATAIPPQCVQTLLALVTCWPPAKCRTASYNFDFQQQEEEQEEEEEDLHSCTDVPGLLVTL